MKDLSEAEQRVKRALEARVTKTNGPVPLAFDWAPLLEQKLDEGKGTDLDSAAEERARTEKKAALNTLFERRLSILTGSAGTGKTSVLEVFLDGLEQIEGKQATLLLAPTGKARVRLSTKTHRNASTIHQFLLKHEWIERTTFAFKHEGGKKTGAATVIIDEASMIPMDLLGVLFQAIDLNQVKRLIFVGDPNQLPPIGPGRPFVDFIAWIEGNSEGHPERLPSLARLTERARHKDHDSRALRLADGYRRDYPNPGDDELLASVARGESEGDLSVHYWRDTTELMGALRQHMKTNLKLDAGGKPYELFNRSLGIPNKDWKQAESWQVLSPTRAQPFGTSELNRVLQQEYKGGLIAVARRKKPRPFGDEEIVWTDKVIQIRNRSMKGWPNNTGLDYVANGEIGIVANTTAGAKGDWETLRSRLNQK